jgi:hypothetical protein
MGDDHIWKDVIHLLYVPLHWGLEILNHNLYSNQFHYAYIQHQYVFLIDMNVDHRCRVEMLGVCKEIDDGEQSTYNCQEPTFLFPFSTPFALNPYTATGPSPKSCTQTPDLKPFTNASCMTHVVALPCNHLLPITLSQLAI